jgi:dihydroorotase
MSEPYDLLVKGGTVLDPASNLHALLDVAVADGRIAALAPDLAPESATRVIDATGCYVTPGLIDFHIHAYWGVNPYGFNADPVCLASGVTTAVDAGSAGAVNFPGYARFIAEPARTRMLGFVCVAQHGVLRSTGELEDLRYADAEGAARMVGEHPDVAVGIKVRLHRSGVADNGREALRLAVQAGEAAHAPVMVHIGDTAISLEEIVETLRPGDVVTHCYTPLRPSIVDEGGRLRDAVRRAHERGVLFDVGHAGRHLEFGLVRDAMGDGLPPDIISTDLHTIPNMPPVIDLPTTMTKFLALGMPLDRIVAACTVNPARAIGWDDRIGSIAVGREADLAVLEIRSEPTPLHDSTGGELLADRRIAARWTIRKGEVFPSPLAADPSMMGSS